ncbi:hypothetical protein DUNSADRAFT_2806 [Dunaliella salina]|uniref:Encoded protein n=1 Tax=Dunaliella salina TaxID=3046 RepID=A0ABQ7GV41_DUNSA|nr:hypothetical protein DUNSADRAFT_2806 [Dunaliella salina]|eukprot:KAF5838477.1 hypothetical protein DUNSADRAFT_2806 [Dunaliella salina]
MSGIASLLSTPSLPTNIQCTASAFLPAAACSSSTGNSSSTQAGLRKGSPPLSSSPPSQPKSLLHGYSARKNSVATQATKEFVGVVVRSRAKPRGRRGCGDGGDEDDYFEEDGVFAGGGGFDDFNWGGSQGGGGSGWGGFNWGGGGSGSGGNNHGDFSNNGGYSERHALFCAAVYNSLWVWQLACLGSVAQAARFLMVCMAAARSAEMQPSPQSGSA